MSELKEKHVVISGLIWKFLNLIGTQGIQFVVQIFLARLLTPADYGVIALITIFIAVANVFVQNGFNTALIQKKHVDDMDYSSVFYVSLAIAAVLYILLFTLAPMIAVFYNEMKLILVLRILSLTLFLGAISSIQNAVISRTMDFKRAFYSSILGLLVSGSVGITMAYLGYGVWALVVQQLINQLINIIVLWFIVKWRPRLMFSFHRLKALLSYGWKILVSSLIDTIYNNAYGLTIGKIYSAQTLGYFNRGDQFPKLLATNINGSIQSVILPALSANQDNKVRVKAMVRRSIVTSSYIIFPLMIGLAVVAKPLVILVLTEKWLPAVPFLQIMCITYAFWPIHTANLQAINAVGRSDIFLKLEIFKKILGVTILIISIPFGIYVMVWSQPLISLISSFINSYPNKKLLNYSYREQLNDIIPSLLISVIMGLMIYTITLVGLSAGLTLMIQITSGIIIYLFMSYIFKLEILKYLISTFKSYALQK